MVEREKKNRFRLFSKAQITELMEKDVFSTHEYQQHVKEVSFKTKIDENIVDSILRSYFTNIMLVINTVRKIKRKINIYGYLSLYIDKGNRRRK